MQHPHGVLPNLGLLDADANADAGSVRGRGLGALRSLPDEALMRCLELLPAADLARLSAASRFLWVFCNHDELWKGLCLQVSAACRA